MAEAHIHTIPCKRAKDAETKEKAIREARGEQRRNAHRGGS